ncbi:MAG: nucleotide exchange factor GrpE [Candidatus Lindowbacteria bacterium]|nr:nucleotide exchange factor GrpE [Candidatus Lindowbacteria bacterium]
MPESAPVSEIEEQEKPDASDAPPEISPLDSMANEISSWQDRHLRLQAEFDNFRKRKLKEAEENRKYAAVPVFESLLSVLDNFNLALNSDLDRSDPNWTQGIDHIAKHLFDVLNTNGLEGILPAPGDSFDTSFHEAVDRQPSSDFKEGEIVSLIRIGYRVKDRLIRPAQVVIAGSSSSDDNSNTNEPS